MNSFQIKCHNYHNYGHIAKNYKKNGSTKVWRRKEQSTTNESKLPKELWEKEDEQVNDCDYHSNECCHMACQF